AGLPQLCICKGTPRPFHTLPVDSVDLRTIAGLLGRIEKTTGPVAANRCRAALSSMFSWAMREGLAQSNPTLNTNKREEHPRDHVLTNDEKPRLGGCRRG